MNILDQRVTGLKGVGEKRAPLLAEMGIMTIRDLLYFLPLRYIDASRITPIAHLLPGETVTIEADVDSVRLIRARTGRPFVRVVLSDETGELVITYFHQTYVAKQLTEGERYAFTGKVVAYKGRLTLNNPSYEALEKERRVHTGRVLPIYSQHSGIKTTWLRQLQDHMIQVVAPLLPEYLPDTIRDRERLMPRSTAVRAAHFPTTMDEAEHARRRLAFDELWELFDHWERERQRIAQETVRAPLHTDPQELLEQWQKVLPFPLSPSQRIATTELVRSLAQSSPQHHFLFGDVGSGKTLTVGAVALAYAQQGEQTLLIAPTTILAQQHFDTLTAVFQPLGVSVGLWTGNRTHLPDAPIVVGTHALLRQTNRLAPALVIVDEEHRFGVEQRETYWRSSPRPHLITMSATPIPRSLARLLFSTQPASHLDPIPGKEKDVTTRVFLPNKLDDHMQWIADQVRTQGTQAFLIAPLIAASTAESLQAVYDATSLAERVRRQQPSLRVGLITGALKSTEKDAILRAMQRRELDVLVATPVIEVGIDIPHASIITVTSAERFGLAQLHQLRGRVGRAGQHSWCFLMPSPDAGGAVGRLRRLETLATGHELAELDLQERGIGEFLGTRQSGWDTLQTQEWLDLSLVEQVRRIRQDLVE